MQRRCHSLAAREDGFTLIEVLVTALIVGLLASATATALVSTNHTSGDQRMRSQADALATQDQERLRGLSDEQLSALNGSATQTRTVTLQVDGQSKAFTVVSDASYQDVSGKSSCTSGAAAYYHIRSTVSWNEGFNAQVPSVTEESLVSRPASGQLLTIVHDQTTGPLSGVAVTASGPTPRAGQTDVDGCQVFAGLQAGVYTVTISRLGYVDVDGHSSVSGSATLHAADATVVSTLGNPFTLGLAGGLTAEMKTSTGALGEANGITYFGSPKSGKAMSQNAVRTASGTLTSIQTLPVLFPFDRALPTDAPDYTGNYQVWAGTCADQKPPSPSTFTVGPGATANGPVTEPLLSVSSFSATVNGVTASAVPADIVLSFTSGGCTDTWRATVAAADQSGAPPTTGWLANPGQPYAPAGTLTVCADYRSSSGYVHGSVAAGNTDMVAPNLVPPIVANQPRAC